MARIRGAKNGVEDRRIQFKENKVKQNKRDLKQNKDSFKSRDSSREIQVERFKSRDSSRETRDIRTLAKFQYFIHLTIYSIRSIHLRRNDDFSTYFFYER